MKTKRHILFFNMNIACRGTPMFPLEVLIAKRSQEISEKKIVEFLSKNFDDNY